jgi:hypothetical protein
MSQEIIINISEDFTDAPGARYRKDGPKSGQEFLEDILIPSLDKVIKEDKKLVINLDGTWGYPPSFISSSFGQLSKKYDKETLSKRIILKSEESTLLIEKIQDELNKKK